MQLKNETFLRDFLQKRSCAAQKRTLLKDALDFIASSKRLEEAKRAKALVDAHVERFVPTVAVDDIIDLPGELAKSLASSNLEANASRLVVLHVDFNVPQATRQPIYICFFAKA